MKLFCLDFSTLCLRFYLMMGIVIGAFFIDFPWLSILALPVFFFTLLGVKISWPVWFRSTRTSTNYEAKKSAKKAEELSHTM